jgi:hypothetical protein
VRNGRRYCPKRTTSPLPFIHSSASIAERHLRLLSQKAYEPRNRWGSLFEITACRSSLRSAPMMSSKGTGPFPGGLRSSGAASTAQASEAQEALIQIKLRGDLVEYAAY